MSMTLLESSTTCLFHADNSYQETSPRRTNGTQEYSTSTVFNGSVVKFGSYSLDLIGTGWEGVGFESAAPVYDSTWLTMECWAYYRTHRTVGEFQGLMGAFAGTGTNAFRLLTNSSGVPKVYLNGTAVVTGPSAIALNTWKHFAVTRDPSGTVTLYVDGTAVVSGSSSLSSTFPTARFILGGAGASGQNRSADAYVDEARYVVGYPVYTGNFTPPASAFSNCPAIDGASKVVTPLVKSGTPAVVAAKYLNPKAISLIDRNFGGRGYIVATVKEKALPANTPLHRRVWLIRERDGQIIRETWSDAVTGNYAFYNIDETQKYSVVAHDYLHNYRAVIADNLSPSV